MKTQMKKIESTSLTDRLLWIARECLELSNNRLPQIVTDERLTELVLAMQDCCSDSSEEKIDLIPDFRVLENHYVAWLDALKPIAAKALWLKPETKKRVEEFIESLPPFFMRGKTALHMTASRPGFSS